MKKQRRGAFIHTRTTGKDGPKGLKKALIAASPQGRINKWLPHAKRLGVGVNKLKQAEALIDAEGTVTDRWQFKALLNEAIAVIENAQNEKTFVPLAIKGQKFNDGPKNKRMDELSNAMLETLNNFCMKMGRRPSYLELAESLPTDGKYIQEVKENGLGELCIYWKRPNGKEETTPIGLFQKRYTNILNKYPEIKKLYPKKK